MLGLTFSSKLDWDYYVIYIAIAPSKKIGALIYYMFLFSEVVLYFYKSTIRPCMEYWICWTSYKNRYAGPLVLHLLPFLNPWLIAEMQPAQIFPVGITFVNVHLKWLNWFHFFILEGSLLIFLTDVTIFLSPFLDVTRMPLLTG